MMKHRTRIASAAAALLMTAVSASAFLTGCGMAPPPSEDTFVKEDLSTPVNANIAKDTAASLKIGIRPTDAEAGIVNGLIAAFREEYPNISVEVIRVAGDAYDTTLASYIPAGTMPDLFWVNPNNLAYYYNSGVAFTLDNYIRDSGLNAADYVAAAMEECRSPSDHYFMMPRDYVQLVMYYNEDMMTRLLAQNTQMEMPDEDWTWDEFLALCRAFRASDIVGSSYPVLDVELDWEAVYYPFIRSYGGEIVNEAGEVVIDEGLYDNAASNGAYRYLEQLLIMKRDGIIPAQDSITAASTNFYGGFSPFYIHSRSSLTDAYKAFTELGKPDDVGVLPMPAIGSDPSVSAGCMGYAIYRNSENKDAAWAFLRFMLTQKGQEALSRTGNVVPVLISEREKENPVWKSYPTGMEIDHDMFIAHAERGIQMDFLRQLPTETHADVLSYLRSMYTGVLYNNKNRAEAIELAADQLHNALATGA